MYYCFPVFRCIGEYISRDLFFFRHTFLCILVYKAADDVLILEITGWVNGYQHTGDGIRGGGGVGGGLFHGIRITYTRMCRNKNRFFSLIFCLKARMAEQTRKKLNFQLL